MHAAIDGLQGWKRADLHLHTCFSGWRSLRIIDPLDCYVTPDDAFAAARSKGMDFVCFTDHDTIDGALDFLARHPAEEPRVIVGEEVEVRFPDSPQWLHINVYGSNEAIHRDLQRLRGNVFEMIDELASRGLFFTLNHPFQSFRTIRAAEKGLAETLARFPGVEVRNSTSPRCHEEILRAMLAASPGKLCALVGGSDAHTLSRVAAVYTAAPGADKSEYLENVRRGIATIGGEAQGLPALVRDVYLVVFEYYRRLYGKTYPLDGRTRVKNMFWSGLLFPAVLLGAPAILPALHTLRQQWIAAFGPWAAAPDRDCAPEARAPLS